jgi:hypothetical protein
MIIHRAEYILTRWETGKQQLPLNEHKYTPTIYTTTILTIFTTQLNDDAMMWSFKSGSYVSYVLYDILYSMVRTEVLTRTKELKSLMNNCSVDGF